jgi:hypothetical protein
VTQVGHERDPSRPVFVISVAASLVRVHPRTLRIYEDEGLLCPARTRTNIRLYSEDDIRRCSSSRSDSGLGSWKRCSMKRMPVGPTRKVGPATVTSAARVPLDRRPVDV